MSSKRVDLIRSKLQAAFSPEALDVIDDSHLHAGHPGAREGKGHFRVRLVAKSFAGAKTLERHRMVYAALVSLMETDIHALSVDASAPDDADGTN